MKKNSSTMFSYSYRQTSLLYYFLRHYYNIITIRAFLTQFQWHEANVLDNWQLAELPQSGGCEFDPRRGHDNLSVPLWVYMRFPVPEHQNQTFLWMNIMSYDNIHIFRISTQMVFHLIQQNLVTIWRKIIPSQHSIFKVSHPLMLDPIMFSKE